MTNFKQKKLRCQSIPSQDFDKKEPIIWLDKRHAWLRPDKSGSLRRYLLLMSIIIKYKCDINLYFPEILMIKESCNLIGQEAHLATLTTKSVSLKN